VYDYIKGKLTQKTATYFVVEAAGVGYFISVSLYTYSKLKDADEAKIFTHLAIKEDAHMLFGFVDEEERKMFRHLISVSGVGTGTARLILSSLSPGELEAAIISGSVATFKNIKGIGEKTAQRIIIDLKDKIKRDETLINIPSFSNNTIKEEALSALVTLGFNKSSASKVLDNVMKSANELSVENLVKSALSHL
jgi:Holliday junction DNA helicase RuvA